MENLLSITNGRNLLYLSILSLNINNHEALNVLRLLGLNDEELNELTKNIDELLDSSAENYRVDLDPVTRSLFVKVIKEFYENAGYIIEGNAGSLKTMFAFMSQLVNDEVRALKLGDSDNAKRLRTIQLRFLNTHLKPLLKGIIASNEKLSKAAMILLELIDNDIELLKELLSNIEYSSYNVKFHDEFKNTFHDNHVEN
jgi:hypothetical protein